MAAVPHLRALTELSINFCSMQPHQLEDIVDESLLPGLVSLQVKDGEITSVRRALRKLVYRAAMQMPTLRSLYLGHDNAESAGVALEQLPLERRRMLRLRHDDGPDSDGEPDEDEWG
jgi:hypothetical protein